MAVIDRLVDICRSVFTTYHSLQKSLAPLLGHFQDSQKKLEQVGLRIRWYFKSKRKVYGCRNTVKGEFLLLTPILTALGIDQSNNTTQDHY